jgi:hypothetical protein
MTESVSGMNAEFYLNYFLPSRARGQKRKPAASGGLPPRSEMEFRNLQVM